MAERVYCITEETRSSKPSRHTAIEYIGTLIEQLTGKPPLTPALAFFHVQRDGTQIKIDMERTTELGELDVVVTKTHTRPTECEIQLLFNAVKAAAPDGARRTLELSRPPPTSTIALIKPGAFGKKDQILEELTEAGFEVLRRTTIVDKVGSLWSAFYEEHKGKFFYDNLIAHMMSGPVMALELTVKDDRDADVITKWRDMIGSADCSTGLRQKYGTTPPDNAFHGSDSIGAVKRELDKLFDFF